MDNIMQPEDDRKYVFVCGLQRSGTSVLARNIGKLENVTSFKDTGVLEDEGQYLQDVYLTDHECGGTGWYGFDPRAHLTERSELLTPDNIAKLRASWHSHWDKDKSICLEKTPNNLIMTRFLQAAFPNSYFIVIRRHPIPVSMANRRWRVTMASLHKGFEHWLRCHDLYEEDKKYLKHLYQLTYEDYIEDPSTYHQEIAAFIGTRVPEGTMEEVTGAHNKKYFTRWGKLLNHSLFKSYYRYIAMKYEPRFANYNYSLTACSGTEEERFRRGTKSFAAVGALYCLMADAYAFMVRLPIRSKWYIKRQLRAHLPEPLKFQIKRLLGKTGLDNQTAKVV